MRLLVKPAYFTVYIPHSWQLGYLRDDCLSTELKTGQRRYSTLYKDIQMKELWPVVVVVVLSTFYSDADPCGFASAELPATVL
jgi:hypothetical protein